MGREKKAGREIVREKVAGDKQVMRAGEGCTGWERRGREGRNTWGSLPRRR